MLFKGAAQRVKFIAFHGVPGVARSTLEKLPLATSFGTMELQEMSRWETGFSESWRVSSCAF